MAVPRAFDQAARARADDRCEYCRAPQAALRMRFWIDHIIASQHLGATTMGNLALSCPFCNRHTGPNLGGIDPVSRLYAPLFHPRMDCWDEHFRFIGPRIVGISAIG